MGLNLHCLSKQCFSLGVLRFCQCEFALLCQIEGASRFLRINPHVVVSRRPSHLGI